MPRRVHKVMLIVHVASSVGWLGVTLCLLTLSTTALLSGDGTLVRAAYLAMDMIGGTLIVPIALLALLTGILLGMGTRWGLLRYYWVLVKLILTLIAATASIFALRPQLNQAADLVRAHPTGPVSAVTGLGDLQATLEIAPAVALTIYLTTTVLSIAKPWGRRDRSRHA